MGRPPDPARRTEILGQVVDYLLQHGLADLSLRPLASALGASPKMLLHHFGSKERLLAEALAEVTAREQRLYAGWLHNDAAAPAQEVLRRAWEAMTSPEAQPLGRFRLEVLAQALQHPEDYPGVADHYANEFLDLIEAGMVIDGVPPERARAAATMTRAVLRGLYYDLLASGDRDRVTEAGLMFFSELLYAWQEAYRRGGTPPGAKPSARTGRRR